MSEAGTPRLSIVSTMYRSQPFLSRFLDECAAAASALVGTDYEIVLVNDGSPDGSLAVAMERSTALPSLVIVDLSRNFGHHRAMQAGLAQARGQRVFLIDCDLETPPSCLAAFQAKMDASGADLVYGYQEARKGGWFERASGSLFWRGLNLLSDTPVPENSLTERLMSRRFVDALLRLGDANVFLGGMMSWTGFTQLGLPVAKTQREGRSTYTLARRLRLMVDAVTSFSSKPLTWLFNLGLLLTLASFGYAAWLVFRKLAFGDTLAGFTSLMTMMAMTLGVLTTGLGLLGIYLGRIYNQVQSRPNAIVRDIHRFP